jgi:hypothetical protein
MASNVEEAFEFWITQFPESHHPLDERRFYDFADKAAEAEEYIDSEWLIERAGQYKHKLTPEQLQDFGKKLDTIREYLQDRKSA